MPLSFFYLAHIERERGNLKEAVDALRKAVALAPDNAEAVALLGAYLTQAGQAAEAAAMLERSNEVTTRTWKCSPRTRWPGENGPDQGRADNADTRP